MGDTLQTRNDLPANPLLLDELRGLILGVRERVARAVNKELVMLYWSVGHRIREEVLGGNAPSTARKLSRHCLDN
jgi:hypothetical protein